MGAAVDVRRLKELEERLDVDLTAVVETRFGKCTLVEVFANAGKREEVEYVVDRGAAIDEALLKAAIGGHTQICADLKRRRRLDGTPLGSRFWARRSVQTPHRQRR